MTAAFVLQKNLRDGESTDRFGFTVTKKTGNAPARNRMRRRLRAVVRDVAAIYPPSGADYVIIARRDVLSKPFDDLKADLARSIERLARPARAKGDTPSPVLPSD